MKTILRYPIVLLGLFAYAFYWRFGSRIWMNMDNLNASDIYIPGSVGDDWHTKSLKDKWAFSKSQLLSVGDSELYTLSALRKNLTILQKDAKRMVH